MEEGPEDAYEDKNFRDDEGDYSVPDGSLDMGCVVSRANPSVTTSRHQTAMNKAVTPRRKAG